MPFYLAFWPSQLLLLVLPAILKFLKLNLLRLQFFNQVISSHSTQNQLTQCLEGYFLQKQNKRCSYPILIHLKKSTNTLLQTLNFSGKKIPPFYPFFHFHVLTLFLETISIWSSNEKSCLASLLTSARLSLQICSKQIDLCQQCKISLTQTFLPSMVSRQLKLTKT